MIIGAYCVGRVDPGKYGRFLHAHVSYAAVVIWQGLFTQVPVFILA